MQTVATAVSVGTEIALYRGDARLAESLQYPRKVGYESLCRVIQIGTDVTEFAVGQRIVCRTSAKLRGRGTLSAYTDGRMVAFDAVLNIEDAYVPLPHLQCVADVEKLFLPVQPELM